MRVLSIKDVLAMDAGETVPSFRGQITDVADRITGKKGEDEWSFQKLTVNDGTGQVVVKVWGKPPFPKTIRGQQFCFACNEGQKGLTGLKVKEDDYRGKVSKIVNTSETAHIDPVDGQGAPAQQQTQQPANPPADPPTQQAPPNGNGAAKAPTNGNGSKPQMGTPEVRKALNRMANLYLHCLAAADYVQHTWEKSKGQDGDRVMTAEQHQACVSSLFIQACRSGLDGVTPEGAFVAK